MQPYKFFRCFIKVKGLNTNSILWNLINMPKLTARIPRTTSRDFCPNCGKFEFYQQSIGSKELECTACGYREKFMELDCHKCPIEDFCTAKWNTEYGRSPKDCPLIKVCKFSIIKVLPKRQVGETNEC